MGDEKVVSSTSEDNFFILFYTGKNFFTCTDMIQAIQEDVTQAIHELQATGQWPSCSIPAIGVVIPDHTSHGDFTSAVAMQLAGAVRKSPLEIANDIKMHLKGAYDQVQIVHPGFLNFFVGGEQFVDVVAEIVKKKERYGRSTIGNRQKVLVEFISANPTGPLTLPNGRGGYLGDVLSRVLGSSGFTVVREYYINDRGHQIDLLGESVARRYLQLQGINVPYEGELYQGEYISDLAKQIEMKDYKINHSKKIEWIKERIKIRALQLMLAQIKRVVTEKMQITYDSWFSEKSMYDEALNEKAMEQLRTAGKIYEQEGAVWARTTEYGDDKDRVIIKSSGEAAYFQGDITLFYDRAFRRRVKKIVLILGADHHGYEHRLKAIPHLLKSETTFDIIFTQLATLMKDGAEVRMSKRKGNFVTIEELIDEVGNDAARFFFLMYSSDRHMNFDLELAKERSDKNPVYYVQYAHARLSGIVREVEKIGIPKKQEIAITHNAEKELVKTMMRFPILVEQIAQSYEAHHLTTYAMDVARAFHHFYAHCRVIDNGAVNIPRYQLVRATKIVLANTLALLGVSAPEKM